MPSATTPLVPSAPSATLTKPLSSFTRLSPIIALFTPTTTIPSPPNHPTTILLCTWMNAHPKHISYYTTRYSTLFPTARILLITITTQQFLFQTETRRRSDMSAAVSALLSHPQPNDRLLVHSLSNGGGRRVYNIAGLYRQLTGKPLPIKAWIIDSAPGIPQFRRDIHALSIPAKKFPWFLWIPYMAAVVATTAVVYVVVNWMPKWVWRELVWGPVEGMNDKSLIEGSGVRGYVYSKEDAAIDWRNVEFWAGVAEGKGWRVERKCVVGAEHVQLFRGKGGEEDYWGFIERIWGLGIGGGK